MISPAPEEPTWIEVRDRVYSEHVLQGMADQINARVLGLPGQLGQPDDGKLRLQNASHIVLPGARVKNGALLVKIKPLGTQAGNLLKTLLADNLAKAVVRGTGNVSPSGVVEDFQLHSVDFDANPRQPDIVEQIGTLADKLTSEQLEMRQSWARVRGAIEDAFLNDRVGWEEIGPALTKIQDTLNGLGLFGQEGQ